MKDFTVEFTALIALRPAQAIKFRGGSYRWFWPGAVICGHRRCHGFPGGADRPAMAADGKTECFAQVLKKMPAVGDLRCMGSTATGTIGINAGSIARDDLDAGRGSTIPASTPPSTAYRKGFLDAFENDFAHAGNAT